MSMVWPKECIEWDGAKNKGGYGRRFPMNGTPELVHRAAWEIVNGPIPSGLCVLHRCDNRACFNVDHLFLGTQEDNMADMKAKGRRLGKRAHEHEEHPMSKLSAADAAEVRVAFVLGVQQKALASLYNVSISTISLVVNGGVWVSK